MLSNGDRKYKQPHVRKEYYRNKNEPIQNIECSIPAYNLAVNLLNEEMYSSLIYRNMFETIKVIHSRTTVFANKAIYFRAEGYW